MSLNQTLQIATKSLMFNQTAMSTLSHNISNVNTAGFTRQELVGEATHINRQGDGVTLGAIVRKIDTILQAQMTQKISDFSYASSVQNYMKGLEVSFGTPGSTSGLSSTINNFLAELNSLANYADSSATRLNVVKQAQFMAESINSIDTQMFDLQREVDGQIDNEIVIINAALERINAYNNQISQIEATKKGGENTNDLRDQRQRDIEILADRLKLNITYDDFGRANISTENGQRLVDTGYVQLSRIPTGGSGSFADIGLTSIKPDGTPANTTFRLNTDRLTSGKIKALVDVRDTQVPALQEQLDTFSAQVIEQFNAVHSRGVGSPPPSSLTSAQIQTPGADLISELGLVPGSTFDLSIVDPATGLPINTATITIPAAPLTGADLAAAINADLTAAGFPATVTANFNLGRLTIEDSSGTHGIVMGNDADDFLGKIKMNPLFEGTDAGTIAIRADILDNPGLLAAGKMRDSDGGFSLSDNRNALDLANITSNNYSFAAAGGISPQTTTISGYFATVTSNLAITLQDNTNRVDFQKTLLNDLEGRHASVSGVNIDEELANMIIFQNSFQAAARVISVIDELYDSLLAVV